VSQGDYLALAYLVVFVTLLVWVALIAAKLARLERETGELVQAVGGRTEDG
jgi:CcmD family protein